jgi:hypothetical protein
MTMILKPIFEEYKYAEVLLNLENDLRGEDMPKGVPKKDGSGRGRGQPGKGCGGNPRKRKGANR